MSAEDADSRQDAERREAVLHDFEARLLRERSEGRVRPLKEHLEDHSSEDASLVARRWLELVGDLDREMAAADLEPDVPLRRRYRVVKRLGSGGQGTVYLAEERGRPGHLVALKQLHGLDRPGSEHLRLRFRQGVRVLERLAHERICGILEADLDAEVPYLVMQYVDGENLSTKIARTIERHSPDSISCIDLANPSGAEEDEETVVEATRAAHQEREAILGVLALIEDAARTLHFAHEQGVVHRDVKPGNIMVTPAGRAVIMDFDMARDDHPRTTELTRAGDAFGTPAYMAPEQLAEDSRAFDRRGDIWALGVTLYQCITLERPFSGTTRQGLFQAILGKEPVPVSRLQPFAPRGLDAVLSKVLEKRPERRYQTALDFAEDLRRVRLGQAPLARMPGPLRKLSRFVSRHPLAAAATLVGIVGALAGIVVGLALSVASRERAAHLDLERRYEGQLTLPLGLEPEARLAAGVVAQALAVDHPLEPERRGRLEEALSRLEVEADALAAQPAESLSVPERFRLGELRLLLREGRARLRGVIGPVPPHARDSDR